MDRAHFEALCQAGRVCVHLQGVLLPWTHEALERRQGVVLVGAQPPHIVRAPEDIAMPPELPLGGTLQQQQQQ